jgi:hypothetical protein
LPDEVLKAKTNQPAMLVEIRGTNLSDSGSIPDISTSPLPLSSEGEGFFFPFLNVTLEE